MSDTFPFLIYRSAEQDISVNAVIRDETVWLTQKAMAELFGVEIPAISKHLTNIFCGRRIGGRGNSFQNGNSSARGQAEGQTNP